MRFCPVTCKSTLYYSVIIYDSLFIFVKKCENRTLNVKIAEKEEDYRTKRTSKRIKNKDVCR